MAAKRAAHPPSELPTASGGRGERSASPNRFAEMDSPRYVVDVRVPGYNIGKSLAKLKKHQAKKRKIAAAPAAPAVDPTPIVLAPAKRSRGGRKPGGDIASHVQFEL